MGEVRLQLPSLGTTILQEWNNPREELAQALARYVGYTTGAYQITRIADVTEQFVQAPSRMKMELVTSLDQELRERKRVKTGQTSYAEGITDFAVGLGLVRRIDRGQFFPRFTLTDLGRAYHAAKHLELTEYKNFLLQFSVLQFDADFYGLLLDIALDGSLPTGSQLQKLFGHRTHELRRERSDWLMQAFPNPQLRDQLLRGNDGYVVRWIKSIRGSEIEQTSVGDHFLRHHTSPRRGWAISLEHIGEDGKLTSKGRNVAVRLRGNNDRYFWLGPHHSWFERLRVDASLIKDPLGPAWNLIRPSNVGTEPVPKDVISDTAEFMIQSYPHMRLVRANQVPLDAVKPFVYFLEQRLDCKLDEERVFKDVFRQFERLFAPMSQRTGLLGYYQLRHHQ